MKNIYLVLTFCFLITPFLFTQNYSFGPNVKVNDDPGGQAYHSVYSSGGHTIAARGDTVYIAYRGDQTDSTNTYFSKSIDCGLTWSPGLRVNYPNQGAIMSLTVDPKGNIYIAYSHYDTLGQRDVHFTKSTDGGLSFSYPIMVNDDGTNYWTQYYPTIAVDTSGQKVFVAWMDARNWGVSNWDIYFTRSTNGGLSFEPNVRVDDTGNNTSWQCDPTLAVDRNGDNIYVSWEDQRNWSQKGADVYFTRSTDGGLSFLPNVLVNDTASTGISHQWLPTIAIDTLGRIYIAWTDERSPSSGCFFSRSDDGGVSFGENIKASDGGYIVIHPSIAVDDTNGVYIVWGDDPRLSIGGDRIFFAYSNCAGDSFLPNVRVDDLPINQEYWLWYPTLAINAQRKVFIAWKDDRNDPSHNNPDVYFALGSSTGIQEYNNTKLTLINIQCYPNPFIHQIKIRLLSPNIKSMNIYDCLGRLIRNYNIENNQKESLSTICWDGDNQTGLPVPIGAYFVVVDKIDTSNETVKVVKIK